MGEDTLPVLEMAEIGASSDPLPRRAVQDLAVLRRVVAFDRAWPALVDPRRPDCTTLADAALAESTRTHAAVRAERAGLFVPLRPREGRSR